MTSYSLIMSNTVFHLANGDRPPRGRGKEIPTVQSKLDDIPESESLSIDQGVGNLRTVFTTQAPGNWRKNVDHILGKCFRRLFPKMVANFVDFTIDLCNGKMQIDCIATKPGRGRLRYLAPRCFQLYLNNRPCLAPRKLRWIISDLYRDWKVPDQTIPYFLMHIKAEHDTYDLKVTADMRKIFFKPHNEESLNEKIKSSLWSIFNKLTTNEESLRITDSKVTDHNYQSLM